MQTEATFSARATTLVEAAEEQRQESAHVSAQLHATIESMPDAVVIGTADRITLANRAAVDWFGLELGEVNGAADLVTRIEARAADTGEAIEPADAPFARAIRGE